MESAREVILAVDQSKFDRISFVRLTDITRVGTVVTDAEPGGEWLEFFGGNNVKVMY